MRAQKANTRGSLINPTSPGDSGKGRKIFPAPSLGSRIKLPLNSGLAPEEREDRADWFPTSRASSPSGSQQLD